MQLNSVKKLQNMWKNIKKKLKNKNLILIEIIFISVSFLFSFWLMFSTFSYQNGSMLISTKAWSDFASTIPLIRSFSFGSNFPPQYPIFPGEPIHYHFLFYLLVGLLEKIGIRIDFALNFLSVLGFSGLLILIYFFAKKIFKSKTVGIISVIFFLFNGSFSFIEFLKTHPLSTNILSDIITNKTFPSFGPYDGKIVSAFWNLNIYTNQRHLAPAFFLSLLIIYILLIPTFGNKKINLKISVCLGIFLGLFFFFHLAAFLMTIVIILVLGILFKELRITTFVILLTGALISIPQYLFLQSGSSSIFKPTLSIGFLAQANVTLKSFIEYWVLNLGLHTILIPFGVILAPRNLRKIFLGFFLIFVIGNTIQFSPEIAGNHKFFNYFMLIGVMFSAFALVKLWKLNYFKPAVIILFFFLILSGVIDFFPIYNDTRIALADYPINQDIKWIKENTPPDSIFLNSQYLYDPASLAGRKIFLGWPYFPWSAGYDTLTRDNLRKSLLNSSDLDTFCRITRGNNINYVELNKTETNEFPINYLFFEKKFKIQYEHLQNRYKIFSIHDSCLEKF